jgi:hypothetical protein
MNKFLNHYLRKFFPFVFQERKKVLAFRQNMNDIFKILDDQKEILQKTKILTEQQEEKLKKKQRELKSISFNSVVSRPPFVSSPLKKEYFDKEINKKFMDVGPVMDFTEREALIFPEKSREKNVKNGISL